MPTSANAVIMVLTYFRALGACSLCEGSRNVFITPSSLAGFETKFCSFCLCLKVEGAVEMVVPSSILLGGIRVPCTFSVRRFVFIAAVHRHRDFPSTQNVVLGKGMNDLIYSKEICQSALGFRLTTAYSYYKQSPFSVLGTRSEYKRQCSCALCTIFMGTIPKDSILKPT